MIPFNSPAAHRNHLLSTLSPRDFALLEPHLTWEALEVRRWLEAPHEAIERVYFMESGFASVVAQGPHARKIEIGLIGREGMSGLAVVLGNYRSPHETYIQAAGTAQHVGAGELRSAMRSSASLQEILLRFAQAFMIQTADTAVANGRATIEERLARWLLMANDRLDGDQLPLTHEFLSLMLGVRRPGVTIALQGLEAQGLIKASRARIVVLDREGLEKSAGGSYGVPEAEYRRLLGMGEYDRHDLGIAV